MKINQLLEAYDVSKVRIDHPEDLIITNGSAGARTALDMLASAKPQEMSFKPDGKPAIKWGRDAAGFGMGDKYMQPLPRSIQELSQLLMGRRGGGREDLVALYARLWPMFEASVGNINGFLFGDLMYASTPGVDGDDLVFKPNTVEYRVALNSDLGRKVASSKAGIVVHTFLPAGSTVGQHVTDPAALPGVKSQGDLLMISDALPSKSTFNMPNLSQLRTALSASASQIDAFLDDAELGNKKIKGMVPLMSKYVNERVRTRSFDGMAAGFIKYLDGAATPKMAQGIKEHIKEHLDGYNALWSIFQSMSATKNAMVDQLDTSQGELRASIGNQPGQEGYMLHGPQGPIKLVNRFRFTAAHFGA